LSRSATRRRVLAWVKVKNEESNMSFKQINYPGFTA
jgi:hypothetical protein